MRGTSGGAGRFTYVQGSPSAAGRGRRPNALFCHRGLKGHGHPPPKVSQSLVGLLSLEVVLETMGPA